MPRDPSPLCQNRIHPKTGPGRCDPCRRAATRRAEAKPTRLAYKQSYNASPARAAALTKYRGTVKGIFAETDNELRRRRDAHQSALQELLRKDQ